MDETGNIKQTLFERCNRELGLYIHHKNNCPVFNCHFCEIFIQDFNARCFSPSVVVSLKKKTQQYSVDLTIWKIIYVMLILRVVL